MKIEHGVIKELAVILDDQAAKTTNGIKYTQQNHCDNNIFDEHIFRPIKLYRNQRSRWANGLWAINVTYSIID